MSFKLAEPEDIPSFLSAAFYPVHGEKFSRGLRAIDLARARRSRVSSSRRLSMSILTFAEESRETCREAGRYRRQSSFFESFAFLRETDRSPFARDGLGELGRRANLKNWVAQWLEIVEHWTFDRRVTFLFCPVTVILCGHYYRGRNACLQPRARFLAGNARTMNAALAERNSQAKEKRESKVAAVRGVERGRSCKSDLSLVAAGTGTQ